MIDIPDRSKEKPDAFWLAIAIILLMAGLCVGAFLSACVTVKTPLPCVPTPVANTPTATPTKAPVATRTPVPLPTGTPTPVKAVKATKGRATIRLDLTKFKVNPALDYYSAATLLWIQPAGNLKPDTPALELSIRGTSNEHCLTAPCDSTALGLVARWSSNIRHDASEPDEKRHCGEGIGYRNRLPIGPGPTTDVTVEWGFDSGSITVLTERGKWVAKRGVYVPGFGVFVDGIPNPPRGVGWAREPWSLQQGGGEVSLIRWEFEGPVGELKGCP